ncbi:solute carrier family 23 member 1-like isoform X2 [Liolophura sinensis]|uniref:solute carrier family 23 member 1-like isoform X2 n=1 Tax=Liolophura sinensis TaxID=3198878 RepID=UPI003158E979
MTGDNSQLPEGNPAQDERNKPGGPRDLLYSVDENPPWYFCIALGLQQYLTAFGGILTVPLLLAPYFCMADDHLSVSQLICTIFFVSGICTLLQTTVGCRLPIVKVGRFPSLPLQSPFCLYPSGAVHSLIQITVALTGRLYRSPGVMSKHRPLWQARVREIQGAITVSALFQVVIGFSGFMGFILRFIGPLAITPTISLIGLSLFASASEQASQFWWVAVMTIFFIALFSQYLRELKFPLPVYKRGKGFRIGRFPLLRLFPVLLGMCLSWLVCYILTVSGALTSDPDGWGYQARTDSRIVVLNSAPWFRFPYPGQWGTPTVSTAGVFAMLAGVLASMVESVGDYYACARLSGAPPPPDHAINRGIGIEGIGCILAGVWGSGNGTTSYSENIGAIGITKVGSRRVIQAGGVIMIVLGCLGKFGALFVTIPTPVVGGMFMVTFGMVAAVGLSNLQFVDLNSSRNLFILGFSTFFGLSLPEWIDKHPDAIQTGSQVADQILTVLCGTSMFVGGFFGFLMDNTIPGTDEERGILKWRQIVHTTTEQASGKNAADYSTYDFPLVQKFFNRWSWMSYVPFCPTFQGFRRCSGDRLKPSSDNEAQGTDNFGYGNEVEDSESVEKQMTRL